MAKKILGYEELQWVCPNCAGTNPGLAKTCGQCGAPQPDGVKFEQVKNATLRQDDDIKKRAEVGADIHCPYCGTRNPGDAKNCVQCGGDLVGGDRRESGQVLGAYQAPSDEPAKKIKCPNCGSENSETDKTCAQCGANLHPLSPGQKPAYTPIGDLPEPSGPMDEKRRLPIGLIILLVIVCCGAAALLFFLTRTKATTGVVQNVGWERSIDVEGFGPVEHRDWSDQLPAEATVGSCEQKVRSVVNNPQPNSAEVCGTPYSVDKGSGVAEVLQDCEYHVYDDYCSYSVMEWTVVETAVLSGDDFFPQWPEPVIASAQRLGRENETYTVYFNTEQGTLSYDLSDYNDFQQFQIGTSWTLDVNAFGSILSVSP